MNTTQSHTRAREVDAHRDAVTFSVADIIKFLQDALGQSLVAVIADVTERTVNEWTKEARAPRPEADMRLRTAYQVFQMLQRADSPHTVRAWFIGLNPQLDDCSPARALADDRYKDVVVAARAFLTGA